MKKIFLISAFFFGISFNCHSQKVKFKDLVNKVIDTLFSSCRNCVVVADTSFGGIEIMGIQSNKHLKKSKSYKNDFSELGNKIKYSKLDSIFLFNRTSKNVRPNILEAECDKIWVLVFSKYLLQKGIAYLSFTKMQQTTWSTLYYLEYDIKKNKILSIKKA